MYFMTEDAMSDQSKYTLKEHEAFNRILVPNRVGGLGNETPLLSGAESIQRMNDRANAAKKIYKFVLYKVHTQVRSWSPETPHVVGHSPHRQWIENYFPSRLRDTYQNGVHCFYMGGDAPPAASPRLAFHSLPDYNFGEDVFTVDLGVFFCWRQLAPEGSVFHSYLQRASKIRIEVGRINGKIPAGMEVTGGLELDEGYGMVAAMMALAYHLSYLPDPRGDHFRGTERLILAFSMTKAIRSAPPVKQEWYAEKYAKFITDLTSGVWTEVLRPETRPPRRHRYNIIVEWIGEERN